MINILIKFDDIIEMKTTGQNIFLEEDIAIFVNFL